jgi:hypothetical protein
MVQSVQGRFLLHVFPGETLITEMWKDEGQNRYTSPSNLSIGARVYCLTDGSFGAFCSRLSI